MRKFSILFIILTAMFSCKEESKQINENQKLKEGSYRASLEVMDGEELPFIFNVKSDGQIVVKNGEERIEVSEIDYRKDSVTIKMPVFEGYLSAKILENGDLDGRFIKESLDRVVPFKAEAGIDNRFIADADSSVDIGGVWEVVFSQGNPEDEYMAKGIFEQDGNTVTGTFRTTTGDYRYLEGVVDGEQLRLSAFDGAHAFLFTAKVSESSMDGTFYSGNHFKEPFVAKRNFDFELPDANDLTFLKDGYDSLEFSFPDLDGNTISLEDERFKDKVVLVQIMGSWCPNCLDESKYYADFYEKNKNRGIEIIALAFEYAKTEEGAIKSLNRLKDNVGINYPIALAQYGTSDKKKAQEKLPMLNHVLSYPTTIFLDKSGDVRKIHTGFNGPATGEKYEAFKKEFNGFVDKLIAE